MYMYTMRGRHTTPPEQLNLQRPIPQLPGPIYTGTIYLHNTIPSPTTPRKIGYEHILMLVIFVLVHIQHELD